MYLLKQKYKEHEVPSLFLWQQAVTMSLSERPWQKLRRNILLIIQLIVATLLVLALCSPYILGNELVENYILVIDSSMSMQATDASKSRFEEAKQSMYQIIDNAKGTVKIAIVAASSKPYLASGFTDDKIAVKNKIDQISVTNSGLDEDATAELVKMLKQQHDAAVYFFTDNAAIEFSGIEKHNVVTGNSVDNIAITLISHKVDADRVVVLVKVKNYSDKIAKNSVALYADDNIYDVADVSVAANSEKDVFFGSVPLGVKNLTAKLTEDDYLAVDNVAFDVVSQGEKQKALLITERNVFLENMLSLLPNIELYKKTEATDELSGYKLYIFDGDVLPLELPKDGHILILNPPPGNSFIETEEEVYINEIYENDSKLLKYLSGIKFSVLKSKSIKTPNWADNVLSSEKTPLVIAGEFNNQKVMVIGFDLHNTDLPLRKEYPIFIYNLMQWFVPESPYTSGILSGDIVMINLEPDTEKATIADPLGNSTKLFETSAVFAFSDTNATGIYVLEQTSKEGSSYSSFPVNVVKTESDLRAQAVNTSEEVKKVEDVLVNVSLQKYFLMFILIILLVEWWVYSRA